MPDPPTRRFLLQNFALRPGTRVAAQPGGDRSRAARARRLAEPGGRGLSRPALFVAGARSDYIRPEYRPAIRALFPAARFVTLKDAGHWVHADDPEGFLSVVEAFVGCGGRLTLRQKFDRLDAG